MSHHSAMESVCNWGGSLASYRSGKPGVVAGSAMVIVLLIMICVTGCSFEDPRVQSLRKQFLLPAVPVNPSTIADARGKVEQDPHVEFVGRIVGDESTTFIQGKASFIVTEIIPGEHNHSGDHDANCPFCKRRAAKAPKAAVHFVDAAGEVLAIDARKLFGVKRGDTVVIRGRGEVVAGLDVLVVKADGIHLQEDSQ